jgi:membrane protease subunit HflK
MPSTIGNAHASGSSGRGASPGSELEQLIGQGQERLKQIMPGGGPRSIMIGAVIAALIVGAWNAYYTVPSDSVAVVQRFGKYLKEVQPGLHFKN